jgi:hypothetical protein
VRKKDDFHDLFLINLNANLFAEGLGQGEILKALEEYREIAIAPTTNRSVLGSMNDLAGQVEFLISRAGGLERADMLRVNMMLNRFPMGARSSTVMPSKKRMNCSAGATRLANS